MNAIAARRPSLIDLGLARVEEALGALGDPHRRLPPVLHVAGTNGKGSTIAYMKAMLEAAGARPHVFTSPHLVRFNERIVLAGEMISDAALADVMTRVDEAVGPDALTFFETITCAAFLAFAETPADYLLLEVGLGGRLDATNVIDAPLASVITPIALDHQQFLGADLASIAREKAGIFKRGAPAVIGPQTPESMTALEACAGVAGSKPFVYGSDWTVFAEQGRLVYQDHDGLRDLAAPRLLGAHQIMNAGLAVAALKASSLGLGDEVLSMGVVNAYWPARLQRLTKGPLVTAAGEGAEIWLDGGHNPHAARAVAAAFSDLEERSGARLVLIAGLQANKDAKGYFAAFEGLASKVYAVTAAHKAAAPAANIAGAARAARLNATTSPSVADAIAAARSENEESLRILICGSLYLAGEVLAENS